MRMWSRGEHDKIERQFHSRGSAYRSSLAAIFKAEPDAERTVQLLVEKEADRLDTYGLEQEIATVLACLVKAPFPLTREALLDLPDDEYQSVVSAVSSVLFRADERIALFEIELTKLVKDDALRDEIAQLIHRTLGGELQKNG